VSVDVSGDVHGRSMDVSLDHAEVRVQGRFDEVQHVVWRLEMPMLSIEAKLSVETLSHLSESHTQLYI
jgi:hypothetical protein